MCELSPSFISETVFVKITWMFEGFGQIITTMGNLFYSVAVKAYWEELFHPLPGNKCAIVGVYQNN